MNGLTKSEVTMLARIRAASDTFARSHDRGDFDAFKRLAWDWVKANKARRPFRHKALHSVKFAFTHLPPAKE